MNNGIFKKDKRRPNTLFYVGIQTSLLTDFQVDLIILSATMTIMLKPILT